MFYILFINKRKKDYIKNVFSDKNVPVTPTNNRKSVFGNNNKSEPNVIKKKTYRIKSGVNKPTSSKNNVFQKNAEQIVNSNQANNMNSRRSKSRKCSSKYSSNNQVEYNHPQRIIKYNFI